MSWRGRRDESSESPTPVWRQKRGREAAWSHCKDEPGSDNESRRRAPPAQTSSEVPWFLRQRDAQRHQESQELGGNVPSGSFHIQFWGPQRTDREATPPGALASVKEVGGLIREMVGVGALGGGEIGALTLCKFHADQDRSDRRTRAWQEDVAPPPPPPPPPLAAPAVNASKTEDNLSGEDICHGPDNDTPPLDGRAPRNVKDEQARPSRNSEEDSATPPFEEEDEEDMEENGQAAGSLRPASPAGPPAIRARSPSRRDSGRMPLLPAPPDPPKKQLEAERMVLEALRNKDPIGVPNGWPAIVAAAYANELDSVQWLINAKADVNAVTSSKSSALWQAATRQQRGQTCQLHGSCFPTFGTLRRMVRPLLEARADPNHIKKSAKGVRRTCLDMALNDDAPASIIKMLEIAGGRRHDRGGGEVALDLKEHLAFASREDEDLSSLRPGKRLRLNKLLKEATSFAEMLSRIGDRAEGEVKSEPSSPSTPPDKPGSAYAERSAFKRAYARKMLPLCGEKPVLDFSAYRTSDRLELPSEQQASEPKRRIYAGLEIPPAERWRAGVGGSLPADPAADDRPDLLKDPWGCAMAGKQELEEPSSPEEAPDAPKPKRRPQAQAERWRAGVGGSLPAEPAADDKPDLLKAAVLAAKVENQASSLSQPPATPSADPPAVGFAKKMPVKVPKPPATPPPAHIVPAKARPGAATSTAAFAKAKPVAVPPGTSTSPADAGMSRAVMPPSSVAVKAMPRKPMGDAGSRAQGDGTVFAKQASSLSGPGIFGEGSEEPQQGNLSDLPRLLEETGKEDDRNSQDEDEVAAAKAAKLPHQMPAVRSLMGLDDSRLSEYQMELVRDLASGSKFHDPARDPQAYRKQARNMCPLAGHLILNAFRPNTRPRPFSAASEFRARAGDGCFVAREGLVEVSRLKFCHKDIGPRFSHGSHQGVPVLKLLQDLHAGRADPKELPPLVVMRNRGDLQVVCGNRRLYCLKRFAMEASKAVDVWCVVYDLKAKDTPRPLLFKYILATTTQDSNTVSARDALSHKWFSEHLKDVRSHGGDVQGSPMGTPQSNPSNGSASNPPSGYAERVVRFRGFNKWKQSALRVIANMLPESENNAAREFFLTLDTECRGQVPWATMCEACGFDDIDDAPKEDATSLLAGLGEKMLRAAYQNYDKSGDQKVSLRDLREGRLIGPLTAKDFKRISRDIGENQPDDVVDFDGFAREAEKAAKAAKDGAEESDCSGVADE
eukprot:s2051_g12.t1